ncbi:MAG: hypothetical protein ABEJ65_06490, partial [bacterium]
KVATDTEYNNASDTEKALYLWFKPNGKLHESNRAFRFLIYGVDQQGNLYVMSENGNSVRKYNPQGEYIGTAYKGNPKFKEWGNKIKIYYPGNQKFEGPYDSIRVALPALNGTKSPLPLSAVEKFTTFSQWNGIVLDVLDNDTNFYTVLHEEEGLDVSKASPFARITSGYSPERTFISKISSEGELLAGFEVLPSSTMEEQWRHAPWGGMTHIRIVDSETIYVTGGTFMLPQLHAYIFKYTLKK